jgi:methionyl-tRNA formyltransferase
MSVVILAGRDESTWFVCNAIHAQVGLRAVVLERPKGKMAIVKARARKLGWTRAIGQAAFVLASPVLRWESHRRRAEIIRQHGLCAEPVSGVEIVDVPTVNDQETTEILHRLQPRVVVVNGTRIISARVLAAVDAVFINMHAGVTPKYRGVHGAYWALYNGDCENAGVTVHLVDRSVDGGPILYQRQIDPGPLDNYCTYPLLQVAAGLPVLIRAVQDALAGQLSPIQGVEPSQLYYHPSLGQYLVARIMRGIK